MTRDEDDPATVGDVMSVEEELLALRRRVRHLEHLVAELMEHTEYNGRP